MKQRFLLLLVACLTVQQCLQAAAGAGGSPGRLLRTPTRGTPPGDLHRTPPRRPGCVFITPPSGIGRTPPTYFKHTTPLTPRHGRKLSSHTRKNHATKRAWFPEEVASSLNASLGKAPIIDGRKHLNGILLSEQRVSYNYPYNLRDRIQKYRSTSPDAVGGNGAPLIKKQKNNFQHALPLAVIIAAIQQGKTFMFEEDGKTHLEIIAKAGFFSNDPLIQTWFTKYTEIRLTFGYTPGCGDVVNPFFLFHARGEIKATRKPSLRAVEGVTAYLDDTVFPGGPVLRFHIPTP